MKILILIPKLTGGGAERQQAKLAGELLRRGHDVLVGHAGAGPGCWPASVPTHAFAIRHPWNPRLIIDIARLIRTWRPDVVQSCLPLMDVAGGIAAMITRVPWVLREPNVGAMYGPGLRWRLRAFVARRGAKAVVANTVEGTRYWSGMPTHVVRNAFELAPLEDTERDRAVLYVGRLVREKHVDVLLRACALVDGVTLDICGEGALRGELESLARGLGIADRVRFHGYVHDLAPLRRRAAAGILLGDWESHPNAACEGLASNLPMILADVPANREIATDDEVVFVPPRDVPAIATAIRHVLDDPAAARARALRARQRAATWTIAATADAYARIYEKLTSRGQV
jgi:glycosyltransferase involved in cell wall biosynthesis